MCGFYPAFFTHRLQLPRWYATLTGPGMRQATPEQQPKAEGYDSR